MKRYIAIDLLALKQNNLSLEDWTLLENIYFMSNNEFGWCYASKETLRQIINVSNGQIYKIINRLLECEFLVKNEVTGHLKVTQKWIKISSGDTLQNMESISNKCKNTLQKMENNPPKFGDKERELRENIKKEKNTQKENSNLEEKNEERKNVCVKSFSKISISQIINFYKENISSKQAKVKEMLSYSAISLQAANLEKILIGLKNYAKVKPQERYITNLHSFVRDKEYEDYQQEQVLDVGKNEVIVPANLVGKVLFIDGEKIEIQTNGYYKIDKDWMVTNPANVKEMIEKIKGLAS